MTILLALFVNTVLCLAAIGAGEILSRTIDRVPSKKDNNNEQI